MPKRKNKNNIERAELVDLSSWEPKTEIGRMVKNKEITTLEQIFEMGKPIKEVEIIDVLFPGLSTKVLEIASVQRMTKNNRKQKYRVTAVVGDMNGHVGVGTAKDVEVKPAISSAIKDAKKNMVPVKLGCGSWECSCGTSHSLPLKVEGICGSSNVILKPAPRGVGIVANNVVKAVLELAGIKDIWSFSRGRTRDIYNTTLATYDAVNKINKIKNVAALKG